MLAGIVSSTATMVIVSLITQSKYPVPNYVTEMIEESADVRVISKDMKVLPDNAITTQAWEIKKFMRSNK